RGGGTRRTVGARRPARAHHRHIPRRRDAGHGARDLGIARQAVPRRGGTGVHVHAAREPARDGRGRRRARARTGPGDPVSAIAARIRAVLEIDPDAPAIEFAGTSYSWGDVAGAADEVDAALDVLGAAAGAPVGLLLANRPEAVGLLLGVLRANACAVTLNPH